MQQNFSQNLAMKGIFHQLRYKLEGRSSYHWLPQEHLESLPQVLLPHPLPAICAVGPLTLHLHEEEESANHSGLTAFKDI